jgi:hypothetical protein
MAAGLMVIAVDELSAADQRLRAAVRGIDEATDELVVSTGDLPPEAVSIVAGLAGLRRQLESAARELRSAAGTFGAVAAEAAQADAGGWLTQAWGSLRGAVTPPGGYGPFGPIPWIGGRVTLASGASETVLKHLYGYPWVSEGAQWRIFGSPSLSPQWRGPVEWAGKVGSVGGTALTFASDVSRRLDTGAPIPEAAAGGAAETATVWACATGGARLAAGLPIPNPAWKAGAVIGAGLVGGAACTGPGRWVGDRASDFAGGVVDGAKKVGSGLGAAGGFVKKNVLDEIPWP